MHHGRGEGGIIEKGTIVGKYQILQALGEGGEGSVYLAVHMQTQQFWALKVVRRSDLRDDLR